MSFLHQRNVTQNEVWMPSLFHGLLLFLLLTLFVRFSELIICCNRRVFVKNGNQIAILFQVPKNGTEVIGTELGFGFTENSLESCSGINENYLSSNLGINCFESVTIISITLDRDKRKEDTWTRTSKRQTS